MNVTEGVVLGLAVIGAVVTANAASQMAEKQGCTDNEQMAAGMLGCGLAMAVFPVAAVTGGVVVVKEAVAGFPATKGFVQDVKSRWTKERAKLHAVA